MTKAIAQESGMDFPDGGDPAEDALAKLLGKARGFLADSGLAEALARAANLLLAPGAMPEAVFEDGDTGRDAARSGSAPAEKSAGGRNADAVRIGKNPAAKNGRADRGTEGGRRGPAERVGRDAAATAARRSGTAVNPPSGPGLLRIALQAIGKMLPNPAQSLFSPEARDSAGEGGTPAATDETKHRSVPSSFSAMAFLSSKKGIESVGDSSSGSSEAAAGSPAEGRGATSSPGADAGDAHALCAGGSMRECFSQAVGALSRGVGAAKALTGDWPFSPPANNEAGGGETPGCGGAPERGDGVPIASGPVVPSAASAWNEIASAMGLRSETGTEWAECGGAEAGLYDVSQTFFQGAPLPDGNGGTTSITTNLSLGDLNVTVPGGDGRDIADTLATELQGRLADLGDIVVHDADGAAKR